MVLVKTRLNTLKLDITPSTLVSFAAVIRVVTQRSSSLTPLVGGALRDDPYNGCKGGYVKPRFRTYSSLKEVYFGPVPFVT